MAIQIKHLKSLAPTLRRANSNASPISMLGGNGIDAVNAAQSLHRAKQNHGFMSAVQTADGIAPFAAIGAEMLLPALFFVGANSMLWPGKALNKIGGMFGFDELGAPLTRSGERVNAFKANTLERELGAVKGGAAYARGVDTLISPFYAATSALNGMTGGFFSNKADKHLGLAAKHESAALAHAGDLAAHLPKEHLDGLLKTAAAGELEAFQTHSKALNDLRGNLGKSQRKTLTLLEKSLSKQSKALDAHKSWASLATGKHNTYESVKGSSVKSGIANTMWAASSVTSTIITAKDTISDIESFRGIVADLKGIPKDEVTSGDALFDDLPYAGEQARRALMISAPPRAILEGFNQMFNINMVRGKHFNPLLFAIPMIGSQAIGYFTSGSILDTYKEMKKNEVEGVENDAEHYAKLIGQAHKELHTRLGADSDFAKEIGRIYAERKISLKQTLEDTRNGRIDQLIMDIRRHNTHQEKLKSGEIEVPNPELKEVTMINPTTPKHHSVSNHRSSSAQHPVTFAERFAAQDSILPPEAAR